MIPILAIDPGTTQSGWVILDDSRVRESGVSPNEHLVERIKTTGDYVASGLIGRMFLAVERFEARGMAIGDDSIQTILWAGRFQQAWHTAADVFMVKRSAVKLHLCGSTRAKDPNVRQALIDLLGSPGTKKAPGPTYGVSSHAWAALGVAVVAREEAIGT